MTRSPLSLTAVSAAVVATVALVGPVAAGSPGKRLDERREARAAQLPTTASVVVLDLQRAARDGRLTVRLG